MQTRNYVYPHSSHDTLEVIMPQNSTGSRLQAENELILFDSSSELPLNESSIENTAQVLENNRQVELADTECRICLEKGGSLISPCLCSGSSRLVHQSCLKLWIEKRAALSSRNLTITSLLHQKCQMCNYPLKYSVYTISRCCTKTEILHKLSSQMFNFIIKTLILIVMLTSFGLSIWLYSSHKVDYGMTSTGIILIISIVISGGIGLALASHLVAMMCFRRERKLSDIEHYSKPISTITSEIIRKK